jgi:GAF domain-containing protein/DNA-binding CsgD family transcriptional regulator
MQISDPIPGQLNSNRILLDLQQANQIAQSCSDCLDPAEIARRVTAGLVEKFDCAFARIWLLEPDQTALQLVASAGMYTHINGSFARVPMGAYKVGKIAQNRVSFLSNNLADEPWVGNRAWAIANQMRGFAGYPLATKDRVIGVLATFSRQPMQPEFLEVLQTLCTTVAIALDTAHQYQKQSQQTLSSEFSQLALSDQFASILKSAHLTLVGTERSLSLPLAYLFLEAATVLNQVECDYCRLIYTQEAVALEAIVPSPDRSAQDPQAWIEPILSQLFFTVGCLGGLLQTSANRRSLQVTLRVPYTQTQSNGQLRVQCQSPVLQLAFTHLACLAGLLVSDRADIPLLTDDLTKISFAQQVLWIQHGTQILPKEIQAKGIQAKVDLSIRADQLRQAVNAVNSGQLWGFDSQPEPQPVLSEREREILTCLTQGHRDRDVADRLIISESTVKFHIKNVLAKLKVRTRYQAIHQAIVNGWI